MLYVVLKRHYPDFEQLLNTLPDHRKRHTYQVAEILSAGLLMFVLKRGSRNQTDQLAGTTFEQNYLKIFGMRLPIMDTVHHFIEQLPVQELEQLREVLIRKLMERKLFEKWKFQGYYNLSFDGSGVYTFDHEPFEGCSYKETKNGIKWYVSVLEAKLVFSNGFSLSLGNEWIKNQNGKFDKQDCEQVAFKRLAVKIKTAFPRLFIVVTADGLYCSEPIFKLIGECGWKYIFTFKDDCLKSLWRTIEQSTPVSNERIIKKESSGKWLIESTDHINELTYRSEKLNFVEYRQYYQEGKQLKRHVHLTNLKITPNNAMQISTQGTMRWKIENEGFNTQKNHGYALGHKYARKSFSAMQNYYLLMQIAHLINQLVEKLKGFQQCLDESGRTLKSLIEGVITTLRSTTLSLKTLQQNYDQTKQLRY